MGSALSGYPYGDWAMEEGRQAGDVNLSEYDNGTGTSFTYYVVLFEGRELDQSATYNVRHILVAAEQDEDASEPTQEQYDQAYAQAQELLDEWKAGDATEDSFAALAEENSADAGLRLQRRPDLQHHPVLHLCGHLHGLGAGSQPPARGHGSGPRTPAPPPRAGTSCTSSPPATPSGSRPPPAPSPIRTMRTWSTMPLRAPLWLRASA